jgi:hypothetical protein
MFDMHFNNVFVFVECITLRFGLKRSVFDKDFHSVFAQLTRPLTRVLEGSFALRCTVRLLTDQMIGLHFIVVMLTNL